MKVFLLAVMALATINCSKVKFTNEQLDQIEDILDGGIDIDPTDDDPTVDPEDVYCPRYDLVVKSTHSSNKKLNFKFNYNGETKQTSTQGVITVQFLQDSSTVHYTQCSGTFTNTNIQASQLPLKTAEALTAEIVINHGQECAATAPVRTTYLQVIDSATSEVLWDEQALIQEIGACEFGYTDEGDALRNNILSLADGVVNKMASTCTK